MDVSFGIIAQPIIEIDSKRAARIILQAEFNTPSNQMFNILNWLPIQNGSIPDMYFGV